MKTKSNNNPSKLQSEAVLEFDELWVILTNRKLVSEKPHTKADIKQFLSDQIQKAYLEGRKEENFVNDLLLECWFQFAYETGNNELWAGGLSTLEHLYDYLKSKGIIDGKGRHIILSIQSKGKMK